MSYSLIAHTIAGSVDGALTVTTSPIDTTGADLLIIGGGTSSVFGFISPTDNYGNIWSTVVSLTNNPNTVYACIATPPIVGAGHTFSLIGSTNATPSIAVFAFKFSASSPNDQFASEGLVFAATSIQPGILIPSQNNELFVSFLTGDTLGAVTSIDSGFAIIDSIPHVGGQHYSFASAYAIQTTATVVNPLWQWTNSNLASSVEASFFAAVVASGSKNLAIQGVG